MLKIERQCLKNQLDQIPCKPRLYPSRMYALQRFTGQTLDDLIDEKIIMPLSDITAFHGPQVLYRFTPEILKPPPKEGIPETWVHQFIQDLNKYGLREAILFFHTYEFISNPNSVIEGTVSLYHNIAQLYLKHAKKLEKSKNVVIKGLMLAARLYGEGTPQRVGARPKPNAAKRRRKKKIPRHPDVERLLPYLGPVIEPETREEKLIEFIDAEFMFDEFPGFEDGVLRVAEILDEHGVNPKSKEGQSILKTYISHAAEEYYGDFDIWVLCDNCNREFKPTHSPEYANVVLAQRSILCPDCSKKKFKAEYAE